MLLEAERLQERQGRNTWRDIPDLSSPSSSLGAALVSVLAQSKTEGTYWLGGSGQTSSAFGHVNLAFLLHKMGDIIGPCA